MATIEVEIENNNDPNFLEGEVWQPEYLLQQDNPQNAIINEYFNQIAGLGIAIHALEDLQRIEAKANSMPVIDAQTMKIARIAIENIKQSTGLKFITPVLEDNSTKEVALEGVGSVISTVLQAIWKAIRSVIEFFTGFFKSSKKVRNEEIHKHTKKDIDTKKARNAKPGKNSLANDVFSTLVTGKEKIKIYDLIEKCNELKVTAQLAEKLVQSFYSFVERVNRVLMSVKAVDEKSIAKIDATLIDLNEDWNITALNSMQRLSEKESYSEELDALFTQYDLSNSQKNSLHGYQGLLRDTAFVGFRTNGMDDKFECIQFKSIEPNRNDYAASAEIEADQIDLLQTYASDIIDTATKAVDKFATYLIDHSSTMEQFISATERYEEFGYKKGMTAAIFIAKSISAQYSKFQTLINKTDSTVGLHQRASAILSKNFQ